MSQLSALARPDGLRVLLRLLLVALVAATMVLSGAAAPASAAPSSVKRTPTLSTGDRGSAVKWVQRKLHVRPTSGYFGPKTKAAVKRFQGRHDLRRTGVVTNPTWRELGIKPRTKAKSSSRSTSPRATTERDKKVLAVAARQKGKPYRYGARGPRAFDCSGFVGYVYRKVGVKLPRTSSAMRQKVRRISASQKRPGDLVFVQRRGRVSHVAIYAGRGMWWEASNSSKPVRKNKAWTRSVSYGRA